MNELEEQSYIHMISQLKEENRMLRESVLGLKRMLEVSFESRRKCKNAK